MGNDKFLFDKENQFGSAFLIKAALIASSFAALPLLTEILFLLFSTLGTTYNR
ncbi:MAG: hypothetical protein ACRCVI_02590 [Mycoplasmoidaceae bacterium]